MNVRQGVGSVLVLLGVMAGNAMLRCGVPAQWSVKDWRVFLHDALGQLRDALVRSCGVLERHGALSDDVLERYGALSHDVLAHGV